MYNGITVKTIHNQCISLNKLLKLSGIEAWTNHYTSGRVQITSFSLDSWTQWLVSSMLSIKKLAYDINWKWEYNGGVLLGWYTVQCLEIKRYYTNKLLNIFITLHNGASHATVL